ncbi:MAG: TonB-dependent receptor, partial [Acidobacteriota bacterium]
VSGFSPRVEVGGPIIKDRLFLEQTAQYRYSTDDIPSRPQSERRTTNWLSAFTRVDANLSTRHSLTTTGGFFPKATTFASLGTFTPPNATVDVNDTVDHVTMTERAIWNDRLVSESTVQFDKYRTSLLPQGPAPMELWTEQTRGNFFNTQERTPSALQLVETLAGTYSGPSGLHLVKVGADILRTHYTGSSVSRPVLITRYDGMLARRIDFSGSTAQDVLGTDVALFAQDRWQLSPTWNVEYGARVDRDGIIGRWNVTPRVGVAVQLNESGSAVLRGGFGLFYERTPSVAGAFTQFETATDTRFAADGVTPLGSPITYTHATAPDLRTARSATWDLSYAYRLNPQWAFHASVLDRHGSNELIVDPAQVNGVGTLLLASDGRSRYRSIELGFDFSRTTALGLNVTYSRSMASSDYNAFANYFDAMLQPVFAPNAYGPSATDVPHRLFARGSYMPKPRLLLIGVADWRTGLPYTAVSNALDFVGARNGLRFPNRFIAELGIEGRFHVGKFQPWIGVRADNAFNSFAPSDVQANLGSPNFGTFYNSPYRHFRLQVRFER